ncbi:MAG: protein jag [Clostridiales bacterium]|nr:protein jag [Clostridiales bacterium]
MEKTIVKTGKTVEEAIESALAELGVAKEDAVIEIISEPAGGFLGLGSKDAEVKVTANVEDEAAEEEEVVYYGDDENFEGDAVSEAEDAAVQFVAEVLSGIGIHGNMDSYREDDAIYISVSGSDCGAAIGRHGETLDAISYMTNLIANKHSEDRVHVHLDVGGYKRHREQVLKNLAERAASKVRKTGRKVVMEAMNPAERRVVHSYLQDFEGITTHSEGDEPDRRVIVTLSENN